jgi:FkbM family methyltransferase
MLRSRVSKYIAGRSYEQRLREAYVAVRERFPAALVGAEERKARRYDQLTVSIAQRVLAPGDAYVDAGAHAGTMLKQLRRCARGGRGFAFEPIPGLAAGIERRFPDVTVRNVALGAEDGEIVFHHVVGNPSDSSIEERTERTSAFTVEEIRVELRRLDDCVPEDVSIRLMKIDVEGAELDVLRGAPRILTRDRPVIVFESSPFRLRTIVDHLSANAYDVKLLGGFAVAPLAPDELVAIALERGEYYFVATPR